MERESFRSPFTIYHLLLYLFRVGADALGGLFEVGVRGRELETFFVGGERLGVLLRGLVGEAEQAEDLGVLRRLRGGLFERRDGPGEVLGLRVCVAEQVEGLVGRLRRGGGTFERRDGLRELFGEDERLALQQGGARVVAHARERVGRAHGREEVGVGRRAAARAAAVHVSLREQLPPLREGRVGERRAVEHVDGRRVVLPAEGELADVEERELVLRIDLQHLAERALGVGRPLEVHLGDGAVVERVGVGLGARARRRGDEEQGRLLILLGEEVGLPERVLGLRVVLPLGVAQLKRPFEVGGRLRVALQVELGVAGDLPGLRVLRVGRGQLPRLGERGVVLLLFEERERVRGRARAGARARGRRRGARRLARRLDGRDAAGAGRARLRRGERGAQEERGRRADKAVRQSLHGREIFHNAKVVINLLSPKGEA